MAVLGPGAVGDPDRPRLTHAEWEAHDAPVAADELVIEPVDVDFDFDGHVEDDQDV